MYEKAGQAEPPPDHPAATMIWRASEMNGVMANSVNGFTNGHVDDGELDEVDPIAMQLG